MRGYRCLSCSKVFDPEKNEICPACGAAVAPSVLTRIERKRTAVRLRAEGMTHYDDHCHEDDAWKGSYGAAAHRTAVRAHEAELRAGYAAHKASDVTTRGAEAATRGAAPAPARRNAKKKKSLMEKLHDKPGRILLIFLIPVVLRIVFGLLSALVEWVREFLGSYGEIFETLFS